MHNVSGDRYVLIAWVNVNPTTIDYNHDGPPLSSQLKETYAFGRGYLIEWAGYQPWAGY
jgi:hypothetical protein